MLVGHQERVGDRNKRIMNHRVYVVSVKIDSSFHEDVSIQDVEQLARQAVFKSFDDSKLTLDSIVYVSTNGIQEVVA